MARSQKNNGGGNGGAGAVSAQNRPSRPRSRSASLQRSSSVPAAPAVVVVPAPQPVQQPRVRRNPPARRNSRAGAQNAPAMSPPVQAETTEISVVEETIAFLSDMVTGNRIQLALVLLGVLYALGLDDLSSSNPLFDLVQSWKKSDKQFLVLLAKYFVKICRSLPALIVVWVGLSDCPRYRPGSPGSWMWITKTKKRIIEKERFGAAIRTIALFLMVTLLPLNEFWAYAVLGLGIVWISFINNRKVILITFSLIVIGYLAVPYLTSVQVPKP